MREESLGSPGHPACRLSLGAPALPRMRTEGPWWVAAGRGGSERNTDEPHPHLGNVTAGAPGLLQAAEGRRAPAGDEINKQ